VLRRASNRFKIIVSGCLYVLPTALLIPQIVGVHSDRTCTHEHVKTETMEKQFYAVYLNPSRPDFAMTMTDSERKIMLQHVAYWTEKLKQGKVYAFGPVIDPKEIYGLGIVAVENEQELKDIIANDPAGKINKYEYFPMRAVVPEISIG
jgi:hypothetical protein